MKHLPDPTAKKWDQKLDRVSELRRALRGRWPAVLREAAALDLGPIDLPGPTGEANALQLVARGRVLCLGSDAETLAAQVVQALASGNGVLAVHPEASTVLKPLMRSNLPLAVVDGVLETKALEELQLDLVAASGEADWLKQLRRALSRRDGTIVPLVTEVIYPQAYCHERAVCVDTTAAGGNASLLAAV